MGIKKIIKNGGLFVLNKAFHIFWLLPIKKNRVFFMSYHGNQYACSPRYISEALFANCSDGVEIVWCLKGQMRDTLNEYNIVKPKTLAYYVNLLTSKVIIHNVYIPPWIPYRKKQIIINTWHGGGVCKLPYANFDDLSYYNKKLLKTGTDYFISSSKKFSEMVIRGTFAYTKEILEIGLPRNDVFFDSEKHIRVHEFYGLSKDTQIILYAPTYRDVESKSFIELDYLRIIDEWEKKTGRKTVMLVRMHPLSNRKIRETEKIYDGGRYSDMQDILKETDCYITDYSSALWDFCLMDRPCILYIPDEEEYERNRPMYYVLKTIRI